MSDERDARRVVTVFLPETEWQGDLIVQELKSAGLDAYLANRSTEVAWGGIEPMTKLEILVPEEEATKAQEIIDQFLSEHISHDDLTEEVEEAVDDEPEEEA